MSSSPTASDVDFVASTAAELECHAMAEVFRQQEGADDPDSLWWLLSHVFNIHMRPGNAKEPLGCMFMSEDGRSMVPSDLTSKQLAQLRLILDSVSDPEVQARLGDVLWVASRDSKAAHIAVRGYMTSGRRLEESSMPPTCMDRYERALRLAYTLGRREQLAQESSKQLQARLVALEGGDKGYLTRRLLILLEEFRSGEPKLLADIGLKAAERHHRAGELDMAREYYGIAARLLRRVPDARAELAAQKAAAETFVEQAEAEETQGNYMASRHLWEQAIQAFRTLPDGKARVPELHQRLNAAGKETLKLMRPVGTTIDLTEEVEAVGKAMSGLGLIDAVLTLALICPVLDPENLRKEVEENERLFPLASMFGSETSDAQGRTIHKAPGLSSSDSAGRQSAVLDRMQRAAALERDFRCHAFILPAWWKLLEEHVVTEETIASLLTGSRFIPEDRMDLFAQGFAAAFRRDFVTALHLLIPQIEHSLRLFLASAGIIASNIDEEGIQEEWPLGRVLATPKLEQILTPLLVFELRGLLVEKGGANLRNRMAHGMMAPSDFNTAPVLYLCWLLLRICIVGTPAYSAFRQSEVH